MLTWFVSIVADLASVAATPHERVCKRYWPTRFFSDAKSMIRLVFLSVCAVVCVVRGQSCDDSAVECGKKTAQLATWCSCCDAVACNASLSETLKLNLIDCVRDGWCSDRADPRCPATPRCDAIRRAFTTTSTTAIGSELPSDTDATSLALFLIVVMCLVCVAGTAIAKVDLSTMGLSS
jgi:hypothetical protein